MLSNICLNFEVNDEFEQMINSESDIFNCIHFNLKLNW